MLRWLDSFEHYATAQVQDKYDGGNSGGDGNDIISGGRFANGFQIVFDGRTIYKDFDNQATWIVGIAVYFQSSGATGSIPFLCLTDGTTRQIELAMNSSRQLIVMRNGTTLGTGSTALAVGVWNYIELKVTIHDTAGVAVARVNGVTEINLSGVDTKNSSNAYANRLYLGCGPSTFSFSTWVTFDDLYVLDGVDSGVSGCPNNDFLGDVRVEGRLPNGNGASSQFDGSDGNSTDNYLLVDESTPNSDTDYVQSGIAGNKDTYAFQDLTPTSGIVYGVQILTFAKKTDAGTRNVKLVARKSGGTEEDSADLVLTTGYQYLMDQRDGDPSGAQWTIASVNAAEFGQKVS